MVKLALVDLSITMGTNNLLTKVHHNFRGGKIVALVGDNGSGKTTILKTIAGLLSQKRAHIFLNDQDIFSLTPQKRAQLISLLFQISPEQPYCTARSRIAHGLMPTHGYHHVVNATTNALIERMADELLIRHLLDRQLAKMSGGEQRLVHIAKCLINPSTEVLLLDEPSVFLDFAQQKNLMRNLIAQKDLGRLIIFSSHDAAFIERVADDVVMLRDRNFHRALGMGDEIFPHNFK